MQNEWKLYFLFSEKEKKGVIALGVILCGSLLLSWWMPKKPAASETNPAATNVLLKPFYFDPNTIDSVHALQLGIPIKQVATLMKYRRKGGHFYKKEQWGNLYGLSPALIEKLTPFVSIASNNLNVNLIKKNKNIFSFNHAPDWIIDINTATDVEWKQKTHLPSALISRIMHYKSFVGSFHSIQEIKKVYGMEDTTFSKLYKHLVVLTKTANPMNANALRFKQWQALGLFSNAQIAQIIQHRQNNGGVIGWREIAVLCDLTQEQTEILRHKVHISD
jgi:DNA uptake protein ComE-like DNA-binding protein